MYQNSYSDSCQKLTAVTKKNPCPICQGDHKCSVGDDGLILCGRRDGPVHGFRHIGPAQGDPQFHLFRRDGDEPPAIGAKKAPKPTAPREWGKVARGYAERFDTEARAELAIRLELPVEVFAALLLFGVCRRTPAGRSFTFPECAADGSVIGITTRAPNRGSPDQKKMLSGGKRGLTLVEGWRDRAGPILIVEGPSDTLAVTATGLPAIGRSSNTGGVAQLAALLRDVSPDRAIIVVGENDKKENGQWPGRDGAASTASALQTEIGRSVLMSMTPSEAKDVRQWLTDRVRAGSSWEAAGRELAALLLQSAESAPPHSRPEIVVTTEEHEVNDAAASALAGASGVYQRGGQLVRVVRMTEPTPDSSTIRVPAGATVIRPLCQPLLREGFTRVADWVKSVEGVDGLEKVPTHPPTWSVQAVHARGSWLGVPRLQAVVTHPILLGDGSLLATNGYHRPSGVLVSLPDTMILSVPVSPTRADVKEAVARLTDAVCDFPFERRSTAARGWPGCLLRSRGSLSTDRPRSS